MIKTPSKSKDQGTQTSLDNMLVNSPKPQPFQIYHNDYVVL